jgi:hypothetical protein
LVAPDVSVKRCQVESDRSALLRRLERGPGEQRTWDSTNACRCHPRRPLSARSTARRPRCGFLDSNRRRIDIRFVPPLCQTMPSVKSCQPTARSTRGRPDSSIS